MLLKPPGRQERDFFERPGFLEKMRSARNNAQLLLALQLIVSLPIQSNDLSIEVTDNEECGRGYAW